MLLSIIILAHNKSELTLACLKSLVSAKIPEPFETLLVDNASSPPLEEVLDAPVLEASQTIILRNEKNLSFSKANNLAAKKSFGQFLLFLNNDVEINQDTLEHLMKSVKQVDGPILAGGKLLYPNSQIIQHAGVSHMLWGIGSNFGCGCESGEKALNRPRESYAVIGAMMLVESECFETVGGFDEKYEWGYEDIDLCQKIRAINGKIFYEPKAVSIHHESVTLRESINKERDSFNYQYFRSRWDELLIPAERKLISKYINEGISSVAIYGTGEAARALARQLKQGGIETKAFVSEEICFELFEGRSVFSLAELDHRNFDRIFVGTQFYFQIRQNLIRFVPEDKISFPIAID